MPECKRIEYDISNIVEYFKFDKHQEAEFRAFIEALDKVVQLVVCRCSKNNEEGHNADD